MLSLTLKSGEYITIGENVVVQTFTEAGNYIRVSIQAPREVTILRGELHERTDERPNFLHEKRPKSRSNQIRNAKNLERLTERKAFYENQRQQLLALSVLLFKS